MRTLRGVLIAVLLPGAASPQQAAPQFEVASVKPSPGGPQGVWNEGSHERVRMLNMTLKSIIAQAYGVKDHVIFGPAWIESNRFEIIAKIAPETAKLPEQERYAAVRTMTQALLAERFKLAVHRETRDMPVFALVPAKGGLKISETGPPSSDWVRATVGRNSVSAKQMPMAQLLSILGGIVDRQVLDESGVHGVFDISLDWSDDPNSGKPSLFTALQEQAGLKLESKKSAMAVVVVDHAEQPEGN